MNGSEFVAKKGLISKDSLYVTTGSVGIGTNSPSASLHVSGNILATNITASSGLIVSAGNIVVDIGSVGICNTPTNIPLEVSTKTTITGPYTETFNSTYFSVNNYPILQGSISGTYLDSTLMAMATYYDNGVDLISNYDGHQIANVDCVNGIIDADYYISELIVDITYQAVTLSPYAAKFNGDVNAYNCRFIATDTTPNRSIALDAKTLGIQGSGYGISANTIGSGNQCMVNIFATGATSNPYGLIYNPTSGDYCIWGVRHGSGAFFQGNGIFRFETGGGGLGIGAFSAVQTTIIYPPTGNSLLFNTNDLGNTAMAIASNGYVGIGTTTPSAKLNIQSSGATTALLASGSSNSTLLQLSSPIDSNIMFVSGSGNVGIGTTSPVNKLDVVGNISCSVITASLFNGTATNSLTASYLTPANNYTVNSLAISGSNTITILNIDSNINNYSEINIQNQNTGNTASGDIVATANNGSDTTNYIDMGINSSGYSAGYIGNANDAYLYNTGSNLFIGNASPNKNLYLFAGGLVNTASMMISSSGNVGIGTRVPVNKLDVVGNISCSVITASLFNGTASWSNVAALSIQSQFSTQSLFATQSIYANSSSWASSSLSASYISVSNLPAHTASWSNNSLNSIQSQFSTQSLFATQSLFSTQSLYATQSLFSTQSIYATSASWASSSVSASYISGANAIIGNLTVTGLLNATQISGSQVYITSSQLIVTDNILTLNAASPHLRYAGIEMFDSGSNNMASLLWDGQGNYFFLTSSDANYSRKIVTGPDGEGDLTSGYFPLITGSNGLINSIISQSDTVISINGSLNANSVTGSHLGTSSWANNSLVSNTSLYASQSQWSVSSSFASASITASYIDAGNITTGTLSNLRLPSQINVTGISGSLTGSFIGLHTGNTTGTSSWSNNSIVSNTSLYSSQSQWSVSSSFASSSISSSYIDAGNITTGTLNNSRLPSQINVTGISGSLTGSFIGLHTGNTTGTSSWANNSIVSNTSLYASQSQWNVSSSFASSSMTASYIDAGNITTGTLNNSRLPSQMSVTGISGSFTGSFVGLYTGNTTGTSSWSNNSTVSNTSLYASQSQWSVSSSFASSSISSSYIDAGNITTGTLNNSRLPTQINVTGITASLVGNTIGTSSWASSSISSSYLSGSNAIVGNLTVTGLLNATQFSGSQVYVTSSQLTVTDNVLTLNAASPHLRYAGIEMYDSGSNNLASLLWDGQGNYFFLTSSDANYSRKIVTGPDGEGDLTNGYFPLITGSNGLINSIISQSGTIISINGSLNTNSITGSHLGTSSWANNSLSASYVTSSNIIGTVTNSISSSYVSGSVMTSNITSSNGLIVSSGNVGIGTTGPSYPLDVNGIARSNGLYLGYQTGMFSVDGTLSNYSATNGVYLTGNASGWLRLNGDGTQHQNIQVNGGSSHNITFNTANLQRMVIDSSGNVGIGTTNPASTLLAGMPALTLASNDTTRSGGMYWVSSDLSRKAFSNIYASVFNFGTETAHPFTLWTSNTERVRIDTAGNVGIGTTTPSAKLNIQSSGATTALLASGSSNSTLLQLSSPIDSNIMFVSGSGNVGIGTTAPVTRLELPLSNTGTNNAKFGSFELQSYAVNNAWLGENYYFNGGIGKYRADGYATKLLFLGGDFIIRTAPSGLAGGDVTETNRFTVASGGLVTINQNLVVSGTGNTTIAGNVGIGTTSPNGKLQVSSAGVYSAISDIISTAGLYVTNTANTTGYGLVLSTNNAQPAIQSIDAGAGYRLAINPYGGNVGIGTTNPGYKLEVLSTGKNQLNLIDNTAYAAGVGGTLIFSGTYRSPATDIIPTAKISAEKTNGTAADYSYNLAFYTTNNGGANPSATPQMLINNLGNVGIGTTTPSAKLNIQSSGATTALIASGSSNSTLLQLSSPIDSNIMFVSGSGNVGIGTITPTEKLRVQGTISSSFISSSLIATGQSTTNPAIRLESGSLLTTVTPGSLEYNNNALWFSNLVVRRSVVQAINVLTASISASNSTSEFLIYTIPHGANYMTAGKMEEISLYGLYSGVTGAGANVLTTRIKWAGNTIATFNTVEALVIDQAVNLHVTYTCRNIINNTGSMFIHAGLAIDTITNEPDVTTTASFFSNVAADLTISAQWSDSNTGNSIVFNQGRCLCIN